MKYKRSGFTLIELLVVIAIIGILATLVITQLGGARAKSRNAAAKSDVSAAGKAIEVFKNDDAIADEVIQSAASGDTLDFTGGANMTALFNGTISTSGTLSYGLQFVKTPATGFDYTYATEEVDTDDGHDNLTVTSHCYVFYTDNLAAQAVEPDDFFFVKAGTSGSGGSAPACP